ncbi:hypothetical protein [Saccharothrix sp. HUAS TT1]|uniref:hypothetical protein n=1 Tax=unclassified Saccharothrix TaxID=2593673 RepID=UPI00345C0C09
MTDAPFNLADLADVLDARARAGEEITLTRIQWDAVSTSCPPLDQIPVRLVTDPRESTPWLERWAMYADFTMGDLATGDGLTPCPGRGLPDGERCVSLPWHLGRCTPWSKARAEREAQQNATRTVRR